MSDYSPPPSPNEFDELEDLLYDADPTPDLADELASHALHSPLLYAEDYEPGYELQEYFSDWEYYSDDYYDDDPALLKKHPIDGTDPARKENGQADTKNRARKRKLGDIDTNDVVLNERRFLKDSLKGTVWATPVPVRDNVYHAGQGETVALLKDWKERFGTAAPKPDLEKSRKRPKLPDDESWANDLSLADMGLLSARGSRAEEQQEQDDEGDDDAEEAPGDEAHKINLDDIEIDEEAYELLKAAAEEAARDGTLDKLDVQQRSSLLALTHRSRTTSPNPAGTNIAPVNFGAEPADSPPTKRRKKDSQTSTGPLPSPPASSATTTYKAQASSRGVSPTSSTQAPKGQRSTRKRKASASPDPPAESETEDENIPAKAEGAEGQANTTTSNSALESKKAVGANGKAMARGKGKATATVAASTASSRAKRAANAANNVVDGKREAATTVSGPARATRSRKR